jgi:hypothetical protein
MMGRMRARSVSGTVFLVLAMAGYGCGGSRQDVVHTYEAGGGEMRAYDATMVQAWEAARAALRWNDAGTIEEHPAERWMVGTAGVSGWSWGATMGIWLEPLDAKGTRVRAVVSRRLATNWTAQSEGGLLDDIAKAIDLEKQGQTLPDEEPE